MELKNTAGELLSISKTLECVQATNIIAAVLDSIERQSFHVAVLGEFKRGKSSLINSLLGEELLPADILPTTATINVIQHGESDVCTVVMLNGKCEKYPLQENPLSKLCVEGELSTENIKYVLIERENQFLKNGVVLIDTPGVNDISQSRVEVTHNILPYCDAALFLMDAAAALTRSEAEFLTTKVLTSSLSNLLFVIGKSDRLDEDELCESLEGAQQRLKQIIPQPINVLSYSSRNEFKALSKHGHSEEYICLLKALEELRASAQNDKNQRNQARLKLAVDLLLGEIEVIESFFASTEEQLQACKAKLETEKLAYSTALNQMITSSDVVGRQTLQQLFMKSCAVLTKTLTADLEYQLKMWEGDVEKMWQHQIPLQIERSLRCFSESKAIEIQHFLSNFRTHLSAEYNRLFHIPLKIDLAECGISLPEWKANEPAMAGSNTRVEKVLGDVLPFAAGAIVGNLIMPGVGTIIGSIAGTVLHRVTNGQRADNAKMELISQLPVMVEAVISGYQKEALRSIDTWFDNLISCLERYHVEQSEKLVLRIEQAIETNSEKAEVPSAETVANLKKYLLSLDI